jgi:hypothetical protein
MTSILKGFLTCTSFESNNDHKLLVSMATNVDHFYLAILVLEQGYSAFL